MIAEEQCREQPLEALEHGIELAGKGRIEEAIAVFEQEIQRNPQCALSHQNLGAVLRLAGRREEAVEVLRKALVLRSCCPLSLYNLGIVLLETGDFQEALDAFRETVTLQPDSSLAVSGMGMAHFGRGELDDAKACFQKALSIDPGLYLANYHLGGLQWNSREAEAAISSFRQGVRCQPAGGQECHVALALALLACGEYSEGWSEYEWRWHTRGHTPQLAGVEQPVWNGSDLNGKTILVWAEQGLGDVLQFSRFVTLLDRRGARVCLFCPFRSSLIGILATCPGMARVVSAVEEVGEIDYQIPLASLPHALGITLDDLSAVEVPYLRPQGSWSEDPLGPRREDKLRVGIVWGVEPGHPNWQGRSCPLPLFNALTAVEGVELYSLQFGPRCADLQKPGAPPIADLSAVLGDFARTAELLDHLDLVVTVDTSMAHLAGAIGQQVWTLLPRDSDWRWLRDREDSPWYPTMRLFRQTERGQWEPVLERVVSALRELRHDRLAQKQDCRWFEAA